ncbi:MAG: transcriptional regulator [Rhodoferax sp.]|nr:transcriptional regulator [Rhodoferax sp.]
MTAHLKTLPALHLAYVRHTGPYGSPGIAQQWISFGAWATAHGLMSPRRRMLGISLDNPMTTPPALCRYDLCIEVDAGFEPEGDVALQDFAGGRHACVPFKGTAMAIGAAWMQVFAQWLPQAGLQPTGAPALEFYDTDFEFDAQTGVFNCDLCVPV